MAAKHLFYVSGMHCSACVFYLEETLVQKEGVTEVQADLVQRTVTITGDFADEKRVLAQKLSALIQDKGYELHLEQQYSPQRYQEFLYAIPAALLFILGFFLLQKLGVVNLIGTEKTSYSTAIFIGLIASVSTCLAVVGGLVLSFSATAAKGGARWRSQALFHFGRLAGFFLLGGVIGSAGKLFGLSLVGSSLLGFAVALVMLVLGLNLLDVFPSLSRFEFKLPKVFAQKTTGMSASSHVLAPLLVGAGTFFLPCGFTQAMQFSALSTGSFLTGGLTMLAFALGTFPVLALLSFGALEISHKPWKGVFFKAAGLIVIALALYNVWNISHVLFLF